MTPSPRIFVNYRRGDTAGWAGRLHSELVARFGKDRVFRDVGIAPGEDYAERIEQVMDSCEVCLVLIGRGWLTAAYVDGRRRLDDPQDLLRLEIERALTRDDVRVIPVLLDGAPMPVESELPEGLRQLARRNACELTDPRWDDDVRRLADGLREGTGALSRARPRILQRLSAPTSPPQSDSAPALSTAFLVTLAATFMAAILAAIVSESFVGIGEGAWGRVAGYALERGVIWAVIGTIAVLATAASFGRGVSWPAALEGAAAGALGGAAGGAGYMVLKHFGEVTEQDSYWLLLFIVTALPGLALAAPIARAAGAPGLVAACALGACLGAAAAALLTGGDRIVLLTMRALLVVGASVAVLALFWQREADAGAAVSRGGTRAL